MFVPFDEINDDSRVWIYQGDRQLTEDETIEIESYLKSFLEKWSAHGNNLLCTARVFYNRFIVVALDEKIAEASGCSIDASVHFIKSLENEFKVNFFDRSKVAFLHNGEIFVEDLKSLKGRIVEGSIQKDSVTFNNLVKSKKEFNDGWEVNAIDSWFGRYF